LSNYFRGDKKRWIYSETNSLAKALYYFYLMLDIHLRVSSWDQILRKINGMCNPIQRMI